MSDNEGQPLLAVRDIYAGYRGNDILHGLALQVRAYEIVTVLGPNGAGKSTVFKAIYGLIPVRSGEVRLGGRDVTNKRPKEMLQAGLVLVPQIRSLFPQMTVYENLELGSYLEKDRRRVKRRVSYVLELFPTLAAHAKQKAGTLSGGEQRMLEIGRGLASEPKMLLIDEPSAGLAPRIADGIFSNLARLNREIGLTVLMIEQNARQALQISTRGYVLELGKNSYEGAADRLLDDPRIQRSFLGGRAPVRKSQ